MKTNFFLRTIMGSLLFLVTVMIFFACTKNEDILTNKNESPTSNQNIDSFVQSYFEQKVAIMSKTSNTARKSSLNELIGDETTLREISQEAERINLINQQYDGMYINPIVKTRIQPETLFQKDGSIAFDVEIYNYLPSGIGADYHVSDGYDYHHVVLKPENNSWKVMVDKIVTDKVLIPTIEPINLPKQQSNNKSRIMGGWNGSVAATFAYNHVLNPTLLKKDIPNYVDYTALGGDCTNFASWSVFNGGWVQNNSWFYIKDGTSGNDMKKYSRSPSWTGANYFGQYLQICGRVNSVFSTLVIPQPATKNNVKTWDDFYSNVKKLRLGDVVQIQNPTNSETHHSMIVTTKIDKAPYIRVSYRNGGTYPAQRDFDIDKLSTGNKLNGFNVISVQ